MYVILSIKYFQPNLFVSFSTCSYLLKRFSKPNTFFLYTYCYACKYLVYYLKIYPSFYFCKRSICYIFSNEVIESSSCMSKVLVPA